MDHPRGKALGGRLVSSMTEGLARLRAGEYDRRHDDLMGYGQPDLGIRSRRRKRVRRKGEKLGRRDGILFMAPRVPRRMHWRKLMNASFRREAAVKAEQWQEGYALARDLDWVRGQLADGGSSDV